MAKKNVTLDPPLESHPSTEGTSDADFRSHEVASISLDARDRVAAALLGRARNLVSIGYCFAVLIFVLLAAGAFAFFFADKLFVRDISEPVGRLANERLELAKELLKLDKINAIAASIQSIQKKWDARGALEAAAKVSVEKDDGRLKALVDNIAEISGEVETERKAYDEQSNNQRSAGEKIVASMAWKNAPDAPQKWPSDYAQQQNYLYLWANAFENQKTQRDYTFMEPFVQARNDGYKIYEKKRSAENRLTAALAALRDIKSQNFNNWEKIKKEIKSEFDELIHNDLISVGKEIEIMNNILSEMHSNSDRANKIFVSTADSLSDIKHKFDNYAVYTSLVTRVSILAILVFLVQILTSMFKYNMRLAASYRAQAESLMLLEKGGAESLKLIAEILMPRQIDFGKAPATPIQELGALLKSAMDRTQRASG